MFLEHFILQTKEDFCTNTLFSSLERGGGGAVVIYFLMNLLVLVV